MSSGALTAAQLDRIEDALEGLEDAELMAVDAAADDDAATVAEYLDAYRDILVLSRDAMPMVDVPANALDAVFAEARAAVEGDAVAAVVAPASETPAPGLWQRLRASVWMPALGFAGAAAALLLFMSPAGDAEEAAVVASHTPQSELAAPEAPAPAPADASKTVVDGRIANAIQLSDAPGAADVARGGGVVAADRLGGVVADEEIPEEESDDKEEVLAEDLLLSDAKAEVGSRSPSPDPSPRAEPVTQTPTNKSEAKEAKKKKPGAGPRPAPSKPSKTSGGKLDPYEPSAPASGGASASKDAKPKAKQSDAGLAKLVSRGESRRRSGSCGLARLDFNEARAASSANVRAKALAGLGLCEYAAGNTGAAGNYFDQARGADRGVSSFIESERAKIDAAAAAPAQAQQKKK